jgi:hypothetical protein
VYVCMYVCVCVCMYVCMYVCMCVCNFINLIGVDVNLLQTKIHWWKEIVINVPLQEVRELFSAFPVIRIENTFKRINRSKVMYQVRCNVCRTVTPFQPNYGFRTEARNLTVTNHNCLFFGQDIKNTKNPLSHSLKMALWRKTKHLAIMMF